MARIRRAVRSGVGGLTTRGRSFLAAGIAAAVCAVALGQRDLLRVALLLIALPVGSVIALTTTRHRLGMSRELLPARVPAGETTRVRVQLRNLTPGTSRLVMAEDRVPLSLGPSPRFVVDGLRSGRAAAVSYTLTCQNRGRYRVGPLRLRLTDPFGMCEVGRSFTATDPLVVLPRVFPLVTPPMGGRWAGSGQASSLTAAATGENDVTTREYRQGDDLRRVHWRSTARRGELMVRQDEQPKLLRATVLLDVRRSAHHGEGPAASLEWAVSAAASVAVHLVERRYAVRVLTGTGGGAWSTTGSNALLDQLAELQPAADASLATALTALHQATGDGLLVAVLGDLDPEAAAALARARRSGTRGFALLLRTALWSTAADGPATAAAELRERRAAATLTDAGWAVASVAPRQSMTATWRELVGSGPEGFGRARPEPDAVMTGTAVPGGSNGHGGNGNRRGPR